MLLADVLPYALPAAAGLLALLLAPAVDTPADALPFRRRRQRIPWQPRLRPSGQPRRVHV